MVSNLEINFQRLLTKVEELADKQQSDELASNWRFEKYTSSLDDYLKQLNKLSACKPSADNLKVYTNRVEFLKQLLDLVNAPKERAKRLLSSNDSTSADDLLTNNTNTQNQSQSNSKSSNGAENINNNRSKLNNPGPVMTRKNLRTKQIYHKTRLNQESQMRQQLFSSNSGNNSKRRGENNNEDETKGKNELASMDKLLARESANQEKETNQMLKSIKAIKANSLLANRILKSDNKALSELNSNAEKNQDNLKSVDQHLNKRVSRSCLGHCWIWLVIVLTMVVFIMMVLFMKLFPKKVHLESPSLSSSGSSASFGTGNQQYVTGNQTLKIIETNQTIQHHSIEL